MSQAYELPSQPAPSPPIVPNVIATTQGASPRAPRTIQIGQTVADVERHLILDTLDYCQGNRTHAAKILGISIRTLRNKLSDYAEAGFVVPEHGQIRAAG